MRKDNFQYGFTTGSCAAGAAKAAAYGLLQGTIPEYVEINTPAGIPLRLKPIYRRMGKTFAECAIRKYSGDDPDITNGCKVYARIEMSEAKGIKFIGGEGVGMVTRLGLQVPQGEPAINPVPRSMIKKAIKEVMDDCKGMNVTITVPGGRKLARKTFNERLGIVGGISIIGTTGIVKPMSLDAFKTSLVCSLDVARASGHESIVLVPGGIGEKSFLKHFNVSRYQVIQMSNFVGFMLEEALKRGFKQIMLAGHPGKLAKLIRGDFYTHSSRSKPANDILINIFKKEKIGTRLINNLNTSLTVEGMVDIIREHDKLYIFDCIADEIQSSVNNYISAKVKIGLILFDMKKNIIGISKGFREWQRNSQIK
jgi:cobalt-precorrin-5B (C1)-methyltransferase